MRDRISLREKREQQPYILSMCLAGITKIWTKTDYFNLASLRIQSNSNESFLINAIPEKQA